MAHQSTIGSWTESVTSLPPNRRYICTHDKNGKSIVHSSPAQQYHGRAGVGGMARSYSTATVPAKLNSDEDVEAYLKPTGPTSFKGTDIVSPLGTGSNLLVVDIAPGGQSQMHRTISIDYSICVIGHVRMELDNGEFIDLRPGDHIIQRGTMHKWWNGSKTEPARFVAVTLPCEPFEIPGTGETLREDHVEGTGATKSDGSKL
ncbi:hypothetical protein BU24DRAFT_165110 [Aaosphaeria arxii CBS 175.79]|uniref:Cupin 2 conserved barrel domain-containing protein n=1 Tax=Aaosphaeria arxii CBS 175.79 TaxID=1450172 RepID=A0A6A5Y0P0_9PLEO|nr:uncharacterized protein BU24DRAFT_165110 [Aaosphaeria arxii CBS 175.79]KAF2018124.1 hypothetical protein BU24DRAFT_165110 [Aaosphaeria arxii CBS 175.79]